MNEPVTQAETETSTVDRPAPPWRKRLRIAESLLLLTVGLGLANWPYEWVETVSSIAKVRETPLRMRRAGFPWRYSETQYEADSAEPVIHRWSWKALAGNIVFGLAAFCGAGCWMRCRTRRKLPIWRFTFLDVLAVTIVAALLLAGYQRAVREQKRDRLLVGRVKLVLHDAGGLRINAKNPRSFDVVDIVDHRPAWSMNYLEWLPPWMGWGRDLLAERKVVDLGWVRWTSEILRLDQLRGLRLYDVRLETEQLVRLRRLTTLQSLFIAQDESAPLPDEVVDMLASLPLLKDLRIAGWTIDERTAERLSALSGLRHLELCGTRIEDRSLRHLAKLPRLKNLQLTVENMTGEGLRHFNGHAHLESCS